MNRLKLCFPYILLVVVLGVVIVSNWPATATVTDAPLPSDRDAAGEVLVADSGEGSGAAPRADSLVDVVCKMEVSSSWGIVSRYHGHDYYFCNRRCKEEFDDAPQRYLTARCLVCGEALSKETAFPATYLGKTYALCGEAHRAEFKSDPAAFFMHSMWGIPGWLYYTSIALVLIVSFGLFDRMGRTRILAVGATWSGADGDVGGAVSLPVLSAAAPIASAAGGLHDSNRFDLMGIGWLSAALRSRVFRFVLQAFFVASFLVVIAAGLFGNQNPALNIAPILTWTVWWGALIILIMYAGKAWCYVCPWDAIAGWAEKLSLWRKREDGLSYGWKWPKVVRNITIATVMFVGLTWLELGFGVTMKPRVTAYLAIAMLLMAVVSAMLFDRKSFCRYGCLVGRVSGLYALFSGVEVRARSSKICQSCHTKECVTGSESAYGCPTFLYPGKLATNTYCIQCMECVQACSHDNLAVNLRPWGSDLVVEGKPRADEAYLALLMLAITGFHGLTMTPAWQQLVDAIRMGSGTGRVLGFSVGMSLIMLGPIAIYAGLVGLSRWLGARDAVQPLTYRDYFIRYAYALLPIALFYHIAHNLEHLLMEGPKVLAMMSDPFGWGWNVFGTANWTIPPLISLDKLWLVQVLLVLVGHVYSLWVAQRTSLRLFGSAKAAFRSQLPMLFGMILFSVFSLWLLKQPMEMRTSAM